MLREIKMLLFVDNAGYPIIDTYESEIKRKELVSKIYESDCHLCEILSDEGYYSFNDIPQQIYESEELFLQFFNNFDLIGKKTYDGFVHVSVFID